MDGRIAVKIRYFKWPDLPHWKYNMYDLGEDDHGRWLWAPVGTVAQRADEPPQRHPFVFVQLIPTQAWWSAIWNESGRYEVYIDVTTPGVWDGDTVSMIDLDVDVVRTRAGGEVEVLDEDELARHIELLHYPEDVVHQARSTAVRMALDLRRRREPFADVGAAWLDRALSLAAEERS